MQKVNGMTLIELLVSVSIICALLLIALPNYQNFIIKMRVDNEIYHLQRLLLLTRNSAINADSNAILCPLDDEITCSGNWEKPLSVFVDLNNNQQFDSLTERVIAYKAEINTIDKLIYAKGRKRITFSPTGHLSGFSNGTFRYCPTANLKLARGIIIAISGRFYLSRDYNNDGLEENRSGIALKCS